MMEIKLPAMSPTMEEGTLAKWLVEEGATVKPGDVIAEIETDKATMELEAEESGTIGKILVPGGTDGVKVGTLIAIIVGEGEETAAAAPEPAAQSKSRVEAAPAETALLSPAVRRLVIANNLDPSGIAGSGKDGRLTKADVVEAMAATPPARSAASSDARVAASPLARRIAEAKGVELSALTGSGPNGRIIKADLESTLVGIATAVPAPQLRVAAPVAASVHDAPEGVPMEAVKLSNMRKTIARRLTESKQTVPHFYQTVEVRLDPLLKLRSQLNGALSEEKKLSVNDLVIKALALALIEVPDANVQFAGDQLYKFSRADVSVAVAIPGGLITPIIREADSKRLSQIAVEMKDLAARARDGKLKPEEFTGGTASLSNLGMYGIKQFDAVINPPQGLILAVGAGEKRPYVVNDAIAIATVMSATGSFDHRAIDGAVGAQFMAVFKRLVENPLAMLA
jgi:pyruvate dehydrogenase E2 component (dihydrolipoamide acetyltransferase)